MGEHANKDKDDYVDEDLDEDLDKDKVKGEDEDLDEDLDENCLCIYFRYSSRKWICS